MISKKYVFTWLGVYMLVLSAAYQVKHTQFLPPSDVVVLNQAEFSLSASHLKSEGDDLATTEKRTLPDNWQWHEANSDYGNYRIEFQSSPNADEIWALVIPTVRSNLRLKLNGRSIGDGGSMLEPVSSNLRKPLLFTVSPALFNKTSNILELEVKSSVFGKGFLDQIYVGPLGTLEPAYKRLFFFRIQLVQSITYGLIVMALIIAALAILRPNDKEYGWFAFASLLWAAHNATNHITQPLWSNHVWDWLSYSTLGWFALVAPIVLLRFRKLSAPKLERTILLIAVLLPCFMLMLPQTLMHAVADYLWYPVALSFGGASLLMVGIDAWKTKNVESQLLTASGLFIIPYAIHDLLLVHAVLPWEHGYYIQFGAVILLAMFAAILLYRLVRFNNEAELLNENLEQQVDIKTAQVKDALQRNRELEKKQWLSAERARITRDMHDGVAGQIISTIKSLEYGNIDSQQIHEQLEYCLNDIRLMVDSLDNEENDLLNLLGMFRYRIEPMLQTAGIQLKWNPLPLDTNIELTPSKSLHILRILQEAVHNTIRHANCSQLKITAVLVNGGRVLEITVSDNGQNVASNQLSPETKSKKTKTRVSGERMNRGIRNMHHRAELIGATLKIRFNQAGTTLELLVPLPEEPEDTKSV